MTPPPQPSLALFWWWALWLISCLLPSAIYPLVSNVANPGGLVLLVVFAALGGVGIASQKVVLNSDGGCGLIALGIFLMFASFFVGCGLQLRL